MKTILPVGLLKDIGKIDIDNALLCHGLTPSSTGWCYYQLIQPVIVEKYMTVGCYGHGNVNIASQHCSALLSGQ
jgi:hypothetical protein